MSVGTAIFIVGMSALALILIGGHFLARHLQTQTDKLIEASERTAREWREIEEGLRPRDGRFEL